MELSLGGRRVLVVDDAVPAEERAALYHDCLARPYWFADQDREDTGHVRHMVNTLSPGDELGERMVALAQEQLRAGGFEFGGLQRAYLNFELFGDIQFAHTDGIGWTVLVFMNQRWEEDWGGELMLYEEPHLPALAVQPRPGRMAIFDGEILHRGGVPSKLCFEPRISLAIKFDKAGEHSVVDAAETRVVPRAPLACRVEDDQVILCVAHDEQCRVLAPLKLRPLFVWIAAQREGFVVHTMPGVDGRETQVALAERLIAEGLVIRAR